MYISQKKTPYPIPQQKNMVCHPVTLLTLSLLCFFFSACATLPFIPQNKAYSRIFVTDYSSAWSAALESIANASEVIQNREAGTIETAWFRNTESRNFYDAFAPEDYFNRARYRVFLNVREGIKGGKKSVVVRVQLEQQVEKSPFSGWETVESPGLIEATYLYRIGRLIALQEYAQKKDEEKSKSLQLTL